METRSTEQVWRDKAARLKDEIEKKTGKSSAQLYEEREKRLRDAIQIKEPDRVPVVLGGTNFALKQAGLPYSAAYYDPIATKEACLKMLIDFDPDINGGVGPANSGPVLEALDPVQMRWPGGALPPDVPYQFLDQENMREDEYDLFLSDPSDFMLRCYLPRVFGVLKPLPKVPPLRTLTGTTFTGITHLFSTPEFRQLAEALFRAGEQEAKWRRETANFDEDIAALGFPSISHPGGLGNTPFDAIADNLRGMRGAMADMYRQPDKVIAACEKILEWRKVRATPVDPKKRGNPKLAGGSIKWSADNYMSRKQFETFAWPALKKAIRGTIDLGYVYSLHCEGRCDSRLEYLLEFPKGSIVIWFAETDMARAKALIGDRFCLMGAVPSPLLATGSVPEVEEYCKKLIKDCSKGGGFILRATTNSIEHHKPENVRAMVDSVKKWGWY